MKNFFRNFILGLYAAKPQTMLSTLNVTVNIFNKVTIPNDLIFVVNKPNTVASFFYLLKTNIKICTNFIKICKFFLFKPLSIKNYTLSSDITQALTKSFFKKIKYLFKFSHKNENSPAKKKYFWKFRRYKYVWDKNFYAPASNKNQLNPTVLNKTPAVFFNRIFKFKFFNVWENLKIRFFKKTFVRRTNLWKKVNLKVNLKSRGIFCKNNLKTLPFIVPLNTSLLTPPSKFQSNFKTIQSVIFSNQITPILYNFKMLRSNIFYIPPRFPKIWAIEADLIKFRKNYYAYHLHKTFNIVYNFYWKTEFYQTLLKFYSSLDSYEDNSLNRSWTLNFRSTERLKRTVLLNNLHTLFRQTPSSNLNLVKLRLSFKKNKFYKPVSLLDFQELDIQQKFTRDTLNKNQNWAFYKDVFTLLESQKIWCVDKPVDWLDTFLQAKLKIVFKKFLRYKPWRQEILVKKKSRFLLIFKKKLIIWKRKFNLSLLFPVPQKTVFFLKKLESGVNLISINESSPNKFFIDHKDSFILTFGLPYSTPVYPITVIESDRTYHGTFNLDHLYHPPVIKLSSRVLLKLQTSPKKISIFNLSYKRFMRRIRYRQKSFAINQTHHNQYLKRKWKQLIYTIFSKTDVDIFANFFFNYHSGFFYKNMFLNSSILNSDYDAFCESLRPLLDPHYGSIGTLELVDCSIFSLNNWINSNYNPVYLAPAPFKKNLYKYENFSRAPSVPRYLQNYINGFISYWSSLKSLFILQTNFNNFMVDFTNNLIGLSAENMLYFGKIHVKFFKKFPVVKFVEFFTFSMIRKDLNYFVKFFKLFVEETNLKEHKRVFSSFEFLLKKFLYKVMLCTHTKGIKFEIAGKISVTGNAKTRNKIIKLGYYSLTNKQLKIDYLLDTIRTSTGVLGFRIFITY